MDAKSLPASLSYWERETFFRDIDTIVIGSGIVGLNAAIRLRELRPGHRIVVLERGPLPVGASTRNAGFACFGSLSELIEDAEVTSPDAVMALAAERYRGLIRLRERLGDQAIDYRAYGGYELFRSSETDRYRACLDALSSYNRAFSGITGRADTYRPADDQIPGFGFGGIRHLIHNQSEGQVHTGKMMAALLTKAVDAGIKIFNGIGVLNFAADAHGIELLTDAGWTIRSQSLLVATNGFAPRLLPDLPVKPARNQVLISQPVPGLPFRACFHYDRGYYYFRNVDGRILLGGGRNLDPEGETTDQFGTTEKIRASLLNLLQQVISPGRKIEVDTWWSGIMGVGTEKRPIVKKIGDRIVVAVRMGGMGVAIGSLVGERGAELLLS